MPSLSFLVNIGAALSMGMAEFSGEVHDTIGPIAFMKDGAVKEECRRFNIEAVRKQLFGEAH